MYKHLTLVA